MVFCECIISGLGLRVMVLPSPTRAIFAHSLEALTHVWRPASLAELNEKGFLMMGLPCAPQIRVPKGMFEDMGRPENDLLHRFGGYDHGGTEVAMVHGEKDPVIPVRFAREFAEENGIPITVFEGQGHSLNDDPDCPDRVADLAIDFFRG